MAFKTDTVLTLVAMAWVTGCSGHNEGAEQGLTGDRTQTNAYAGIAPPQQRIIRRQHIELLEASSQQSLEASPRVEPPSAVPTSRVDPLSSRTIIQVNFQDREQLELEIDPAELQRVVSEAAARGLVQQLPGGAGQIAPASDGDEGDETPKAWSNSIDNRIRLGIEDGYPANHSELGRYGKIESGKMCTATAFGRRLLLTAAHCLFDTSGNGHAATYYPRLNGATRPYPAVVAEAAWYGGQFVSKGCNTTYNFQNCTIDDWAILLAPTNASLGGAGWMGYASLNESSTLAYTYKHYGYPKCGLSSSPAGCTSNYAYGQTTECHAGDFNAYVNGFGYAASIGCDTSEGHSGGAVFIPNGAYIVGEFYYEVCSPNCQSGGNYPNYMRRIDSYVFNLMTSLRSQYP